jgi:membrane protein involved in colicin uptake
VKLAITIIVMSLLSYQHANASSLTMQQQTNEIANQRDELLRQQSELERLKRENKEYEQELLRQNTEQDNAINELKRQNDETLRQRRNDALSQQIERSDNDQKAKNYKRTTANKRRLRGCKLTMLKPPMTVILY